VIPPGHDAEFVSRMEPVLDEYERPFDPDRPSVNIDEASVQLIEQTRAPVPAAPGQPARIDYEYKRNGTANLFVAFQPLLGWREIVITERRTALDFAVFLKHLADDIYAEAEKITLVLDNLNTHSAASLYQAFSPAEAHRLAGRFAWVYTPKHGSWLNMAEVEFAALRKQCLDRRLGTMAELKTEVEAWQDARNDREVIANWQFRTPDARVKLRHLYPQTRAT
jgi:DDE superfamily endonuclease